MSSVVSQCVTQVLCRNHGCLDFKQLEEIVGQRFTVADEVLSRVLCDGENFAIIEGKLKASGRLMSPDNVIVAKTSLRVCQSPPGECPDGECDNLHLCRYFICGNCRFGNKCKNSHSLNADHSRSLLSRLRLQELSGTELCSLLLQNDPYLLPEICPHYNKGNGEHGSCKFKTSCTNLHMCLHFLQGDCRFGASCKRAHVFSPAAVKILNGRGLSQENIRMLHQIYRNRLMIVGHSERAAVVPVVTERSRPPSCGSSPALPAASSGGSQISSHAASEADKNEICLFFIRRNCSFKDKCVRVHYHLPYKWQVQDRDGVTWRDLPSMEDIEKAYCDPAKDTSGGILAVNFLTMDLGGSPVRRLSTSSSVTKPPHFILTTQWLWHWKDELGQWVQYGLESDAEGVASITSLTLENVYQADADPEIHFGVGKHQYVLHFKEMYQQNVRYKTKREVRRRPDFLSGQDVEARLNSGSSESSASNSSLSSAVAVPPHWDKRAPVDSATYTLVPLPRSLKEYGMVEKLFKTTMGGHTVHSVQRVQNPALWRVFQWQKEQMKQRSGGMAVEEKHLFHGTDPSLIDAICEQNFDWRVCGANGTLYGRGSYFARDASYSHNYTRESNGSKKKQMFVALVLVGEFTRGSGSYVKPPAKKTGKGFYDSCVDSERSPSIFVVFEKHQIYPEYIIKYS